MRKRSFCLRRFPGISTSRGKTQCLLKIDAYAAELRGIGIAAKDQPEWRQKSLGPTISYGMTSESSIQEQKVAADLQLKEPLLKAFASRMLSSSARRVAERRPRSLIPRGTWPS